MPSLLRASGLPKPTFARILRTLIAYGLVRQDEARGTYVLGQRFLEMSHKVWESFDLVSAATRNWSGWPPNWVRRLRCAGLTAP